MGPTFDQVIWACPAMLHCQTDFWLGHLSMSSNASLPECFRLQTQKIKQCEWLVNRAGLVIYIHGQRRLMLRGIRNRKNTVTMSIFVAWICSCIWHICKRLYFIYFFSNYLNLNLPVTPKKQGLFCFGLSQWEMVLPCNIASYWLSQYTEWSLKKSIYAWDF